MHNDYVSDNILSAIVSCEFQPGSQLQETRLAEQYETSRTKVREALVGLAARNFVHLEHNKGAVVAPLDVSVVYSVFELRIAVEKAAAVLAASRIAKAGIAELSAHRENLRFASNNNDEDTYFDQDGEIHMAIARISLNPLIEEQVAIMRLHTRRCWYFYKDRGLREVADYKGMIAVLDAICAGKPEVAAEAMFEHLSLYHASFSDMLNRQTRDLHFV